MADQYFQPDETGWSLKGLVKGVAKGVSKAAKGAVKVASHVPGVSAVTAPVGLISDVARGKNVIKSVRKRGATIVKDVQRAAPIAANVASFVPGVGTAVSSGLSAVSAAAQGKSISDIATAAAQGAVPGGAIIRQGLAVASDVAKGRNVVKSVGRGVVNYAQSQVPGGQYLTPVVTAATDIARGRNVVSSVGKQALNVARQEITKQVQTNMPKILTRPSYGLIPDAQPEFIGRVAKIGRNLPPVLRQPLVIRQPRASFRPLSTVARRFLRSSVPYGEVAGLTESGAQWQVESGDTGSKIALKLTGNSARWTELRAVNPKIMARSPDLIKKYGFPIYVGDLVNLPASWVKVAPSVSPTEAPKAVAPDGDLAALSQARTILIAWSKSDGAREAGVSDYGSSADLNSSVWSSRDTLQAASFGKWWNAKTGSPAVDTSGAWNDALAKALNAWAEAKTRAITNEAIKTASPAVTPAAVITEVAPKIAAQIAQATGVPLYGGDPITQGPQTTTPAVTTPTVTTPAVTTPAVTTNVAPSSTAAQVASSSGASASQAAVPNTSAKWAIGSVIVSTLGAAFLKAV